MPGIPGYHERDPSFTICHCFLVLPSYKSLPLVFVPEPFPLSSRSRTVIANTHDPHGNAHCRKQKRTRPIPRSTRTRDKHAPKSLRRRRSSNRDFRWKTRGIHPRCFRQRDNHNHSNATDLVISYYSPPRTGHPIRHWGEGSWACFQRGCCRRRRVSWPTPAQIATLVSPCVVARQRLARIQPRERCAGMCLDVLAHLLVAKSAQLRRAGAHDVVRRGDVLL